MKKYLSVVFVSIGLMAGLLGAMVPSPVGAVDVFGNACGGNKDAGTTGGGAQQQPGGGGVSANLNDGSSKSGSTICTGQKDDLNKMMRTVINIILTILGTIAVIMIIIGGIRYTTSNGDASGIKSAKDTIMYAVIGLVVAILSFAIVNFVLDAFTSK